MRSHLIQDLEQTPGRDPTRSEETPEETREGREEEILEEVALETHSQADFWPAGELKHERPGPFPLFSTEIAPRQGYSSEP